MLDGHSPVTQRFELSSVFGWRVRELEIKQTGGVQSAIELDQVPHERSTFPLLLFLLSAIGCDTSDNTVDPLVKETKIHWFDITDSCSEYRNKQ